MEILFPVVLFLVFTLSALFIILYAASTYRHIVQESNIQYDESTSMSYLTRKIKSQDCSGNISIGHIGDLDTLEIAQEIDGEIYITYIYAYNGSLREYFTAAKNTQISPDGGTVLFTADSFEPEFLNSNIISLSITRDGKEQNRLVSIHSTNDNKTEGIIELPLYAEGEVAK